MMKAEEFESMMRSIKLVDNGDHQQFAEQVIRNVANAGGVDFRVGEDISTSEKLIRAYEGTAKPSGESNATKLYGGMPALNKFKLGKASEKELVGVKTEIVLITRLAICLSSQDFTVFDGLRTIKEQQLHIVNGTSKTLNSKHLQGLAVDLVPWINGKPVWDWEGCYKIAQAFDAAATHLGFANKVRWGGAWDRSLSDFGNPNDWSAYETEVSQYHRRTGKSFVDGPHFEWVW